MTNKIPQRHDRLTKSFLTDPTVAREFLEIHHPKGNYSPASILSSCFDDLCTGGHTVPSGVAFG